MFNPQNKNINSNQNRLVDYIFWIVFIVFTNPGGILEAFGEDSGDGGVNVTDYLFFVLIGCYALVLHKKNEGFNIEYNKLAKLLILFLAYYFIVFGYLVPELKGSASSTFTFIVIKSRETIYSVLLFFMIYKFFLRDYTIFFKILLFSSITVIILFLITVTTGLDIIPIMQADRRFIKINRIFLVSYGLMPLLIPMGAVILAFKINIKWKKLILIGFGLMFLTWLLSLTRRQIFGTVFYLIIALMIYNYFQRKVLLPLGKLVSILFYSLIILFFIGLAFPKYVDAGAKSIEEAIYVIEYGETSTGKKDVRLGFGKDIMRKLIKENYIWGTGFDNRWRTADGDKAGYETSDYPLLAALAMKGVFGMLIFLPIYIVLIKALRKDYKFIRDHNVDYQSVEFFILVLFILFFSYDLLQYINWFRPLSRSTEFPWYVYLAMYMAIRNILYYKNSFHKKTDPSKIIKS